MTDHDLDELLADLHTDVPPMTAAAFEAGLARLEGVVDSGRVLVETTPVPVVTPLPSRRGRRSPPRLVTQLVAAAAAVVAVSTGVLLVQDSGPVTPASVTTPEQLAAWAAGLADDPPAFGPGQFRYQHTQYRSAMDVNGDPRFRTESTTDIKTWIPYDYRDNWRVEYGPSDSRFTKGTREEAENAGVLAPGDPTPGGLEHLRTDTADAACGQFGTVTEVRPVEGREGEFTTKLQDLCVGDGWDWVGSPEFYRGLTGDPQQLYDILHEKAVDRGAGIRPELFVQADPLLAANAPKDFKATLYQAMSRIPGLVVLDNATTSDGRTGIGLRVTQNGTTELWVLDRVTGDHLEVRETAAWSDSVRTFTYGVADELGGDPVR